ncbi:hypothetical protein [Micromonospora craterilacus]|nr:hypothetical protein [Micromonospora craterilacus]
MSYDHDSEPHFADLNAGTRSIAFAAGAHRVNSFKSRGGAPGTDSPEV